MKFGETPDFGKDVDCQMEEMTLNEIALATGSTCPDSIKDRKVDSICIDSRKLSPGCLFIAIRGENFDGHSFISQALEKGAAAALSSCPSDGDERVLTVKDTKRALLDLARYYRRRFSLFLTGVTGSVGKTSTKEMIYAILSAKGKTLKTEGNFNNEIGMPLTMFRLDHSYQNAVVEMGMSNFGEISDLTHVCVPNAAVITNIGVSHIEALGSRENILKAKMEITESMEPNSPLILNGDDDLLRTVNHQTDRPIIYYGIDSGSDVTASDIQTADGMTSFLIHYYGQSISAVIPTIGRHNVYNALAGFCVGLAADMEPEQIVRAMRLYKNAGLRQNTTVTEGITVIADCYNASPASMQAALDVICTMECTGRRICVFGDMLELGDYSEEAHQEVGRMVGRANMDLLLCYGEESRAIKRGAMMVGMKNVRHFAEQEELADFLVQTLRPGDAVIYKASRGMKLERVIEMVDQKRRQA